MRLGAKIEGSVLIIEHESGDHLSIEHCRLDGDAIVTFENDEVNSFQERETIDEWVSGNTAHIDNESVPVADRRHFATTAAAFLQDRHPEAAKALRRAARKTFPAGQCSRSVGKD
jgi:hypothetical protein